MTSPYYSCPEHERMCGGDDCCCADLHVPTDTPPPTPSYPIDWVEFLRIKRPNGLTYLSEDMALDLANEIETLKRRNVHLVRYMGR